MQPGAVGTRPAASADPTAAADPGTDPVTDPGTEPPRRPDGRRARWAEHRRARREDLVDAAVEAVRATGPELAVEDVARAAGVSKTVIYRYFTDKDELLDAVLERISSGVLLPRLLGELAVERADLARLRAVIAAFVELVDEQPALYRFVHATSGRAGRADLVAATEREIAVALGRLLADRLAGAGRPTAPATTWAYGVVGMVHLATHWWVDDRSVPAAELIDQLTALAAGGLVALLPPAEGR